MARLDTLINPEEIIGFVRSIYLQLSTEFALGRFFPDQQLSRNQFRTIVDNRVPVAAAKFRAWDTEAPLATRQGVSRKRWEVAPISLKMFMGEEHELQFRAYDRQDFGPIIDQLYDDLATLTESVVTTFEGLRGEVLSAGTCTVPFVDGTTQVIDYGIKAEHKVTAGTLWSDAAADVIGDITTWQNVYRTTNRNRNPAAILISSRIAGYLLRNTGFRVLLGTTLGTPSAVSLAQIQGILQTQGLPPLIVIDEQVANTSGVVTSVLPDNKAIFVSANGPIGNTMHGVTPASLGMVDDEVIQRGTAPGIIGQVWKNHDPYARWSLVEAIGFPAVGNPNDLLIGTVLS
jgi:hypothetical protein